MSLEHIVLTLTLTLENYGTEYDYDDLYDYIYDYYYNYYDRSEDSEAFKDFQNLKEVAKGNTDRDVYDWLGDSHPKRGDIKVELVSPSGTKSTLLPYRRYDFINAEGYDNWPFMSLHYWGENPIGTWTMHVYFKSSYGYVSVHVNSLELYGTNVASTTSYSTSTSTTSYSTSTSTSSTSSSSTSDSNDNIILPVIIGGVALLIFSIAIVFFVIVIVVLKIRKNNRRLPRYQMMPVGNNENET